MKYLLAILPVVAAACSGSIGGGSGDPPAGADAATAGDTPAAGDSNGAGDPLTTGDPAVAGDPNLQVGQTCDEITAQILGNTDATILVSPGAFGQVEVSGSATTLRQVIQDAQSGETILLADGTYTFEEAAAGSYTGLYFSTPNVTMRSASGDAAAVVLDSGYADHGNSSSVIVVGAPGIVLADFTVQRSIFHLIHFWSDGDAALVHNVHLIDGGQQFIKASGTNIDSVEVSCSRFEMTPAGRDNVWGYGAVDGGTRCYTGGIDTHNSRSWHVHDNTFEGIYCNAGGVGRPVHGKYSELRDDQTYTGGLSEHAIHMWDSPDGYGHVIERNRIVNCARGIGLGMTAEVYDTAIRNNMVFSEHAGSAEHDVGISIERGHDSQILNNTVFFSSASAYSNAIEYRWGSTTNLELRNNLTNRAILPRDGATDATTSNNVEDAQAAWLENVAAGDLHLSSCTIPSVAGMGVGLASVTDDIDEEPRTPGNDVGADQCQ